MKSHPIPTTRSPLAAAGFVTLLFLAPLHAAVISNITLSGTQNTTAWTNLKNTNAGLLPASGTGTATVQAPGYQAGVGLYSFSSNYSSTVTQVSSFDIHTVVFQADLSPNPDFPLPFSGGPLLSFNGGSQSIAASYFLIQGSENRVTSFGPQTYTGAAWQWDLSGYGETINSISILQPYSVHTAVAGLRIDSGSTFAQVIPEPSALGLCGLAAGLMAFRRQRGRVIFGKVAAKGCPMHGESSAGVGHFLPPSARMTPDRQHFAGLRKHRPSQLVILSAIALFTSGLHAAETAFDKDRKAILGMSGEFAVEFYFQETLSLHPDYKISEKPYREEANEIVKVAEDSGKRIVLQHILQVDNLVVKHWSQVWTYEDDAILEFQGDSKWQQKPLSGTATGSWTQRVTEVTDAPRYEVRGTWVHHPDSSEWTSELTNRPLPRREYTTRRDYDLLQVTNRHTVTATGWFHEQDNTKWVRRDGEKYPLCREIGMNRYLRTQDADFAKANRYWEKTAGFWQQVRSCWDEAALAQPTLSLQQKLNNHSLYQEMLALTQRVTAGKPVTDSDIRSVLTSFLAAVPATHQP